MIRIQWSDTNSARDPVVGGDTIELVFSELVIDATITETTDISAEPTAHPVEEGVDVTDHSHPALRRINIDCVISNQPTDAGLMPGAGVQTTVLQLPSVRRITSGSVGLQRSTSILVPQPTMAVRTIKFDGDVDRVKEAVDQLDELIMSATRVDILDLRLGDLEDWLLINMSPLVEARESVSFTLVAQELRTAVTETVAAPSPRVERGRRRRARGRQRGEGEDSESQSTRSRVSALRQAMNGLSGVVSNMPSLPSL
jgi:hypothetical protein